MADPNQKIALGDPDEGVDGPGLVGEFIYALVEKNPKLEVYLMRWDIAAITSIFRGITPLTLLNSHGLKMASLAKVASCLRRFDGGFDPRRT